MAQRAPSLHNDPTCTGLTLVPILLGAGSPPLSVAWIAFSRTRSVGGDCYARSRIHELTPCCNESPCSRKTFSRLRSCARGPRQIDRHLGACTAHDNAPVPIGLHSPLSADGRQWKSGVSAEGPAASDDVVRVLWTTPVHFAALSETWLMDGFCTPPDDDEDPVMMLWRMENDSRKRRNGDQTPDASERGGAGAVILEFRPRRD